MYLTQLLHRLAELEPDRLLTVDGERRRTVSDTCDRVARLAGGLRAAGVAEGDRVAVLALNSDRYVEILLAVPWADAVVVPVNVRWAAAEIEYSLVDCAVNVLIVDDAFAALAPQLRAAVPSLAVVVHAGEGPLPADAVSYEELIARSEPVPDARRGGDALYGVFYTGGTTGEPKGVMLSHDNLLASAFGTLTTSEVVGRNAVLLHTAPMFHLADIAALVMGFLGGATHVTLPSFTPAGVLQAVAEHGVTDMLLVPTMIQLLVDAPAAHDADLSSLARIMYGASPISPAVLGRARALLPHTALNQCYGMTELSPVVTVLTAADHDDRSLLTTAGRPTTVSELRIVDALDQPVGAGSVGEITVRGDHVMLGYWNKPAETEAALRGGWMHTGDGGFLDERGYLHVVDRIKDMIVTGGENVYSVEVENAVARHAAVASCAVIGLPDEEWGERVHAVVVLHEGSDLDLEELREACRAQIAGYKLPRSLEIVSALPISGAGKVLKRELRADARVTRPAGPGR